jgi:TRAP-type C4-dicarboxylate transport system substrate-binding protein
VLNGSTLTAVLDTPISMRTSHILVGSHVWEQLTQEQQALIEREASAHARALRSIIAAEEDSWFGELAIQPVDVVQWSAEEQAHLRRHMIDFLRKWASLDPDPTWRSAIVDSLEAFQRANGLI